MYASPCSNTSFDENWFEGTQQVEETQPVLADDPETELSPEEFDAAMLKLVTFGGEISKMLKVMALWKISDTKFVKDLINAINDLRVKASALMSIIDNVMENPTNKKVSEFDLDAVENNLIEYLREYNELLEYVNLVNSKPKKRTRDATGFVDDDNDGDHDDDDRDNKGEGCMMKAGSSTDGMHDANDVDGVNGAEGVIDVSEPDNEVAERTTMVFDTEGDVGTINSL
jgi:hypothetical protein